jgi:hypothetical protein
LIDARAVTDEDGAEMSPAELRLVVATLKHDLGKYIAWRSVHLEERAWHECPVPGELVDALVCDLLRTRAKGEREEPAWQVWERLTASITRPFSLPELSEVADAVEQLRRAEGPLRQRDLAGLDGLRPAIRTAQTRIRDSLARLHRRLSSEGV